MKNFGLILLFFFVVISDAIACVVGYQHQNPPNHRAYVGTGCVYYDGRNRGFIVEGPFRGFIIADELLPGFAALQKNDPKDAYARWSRSSESNLAAASFNLAVLSHRGIGISRDWVKALDFLTKVMEDITHFNTAHAYAVRITQEADQKLRRPYPKQLIICLLTQGRKAKLRTSTRLSVSIIGVTTHVCPANRLNRYSLM